MSTAKQLKQEWGVKVAHALYRSNGTWYHLLDKFPGALLDANGYVIFETEDDYRNCKELHLGTCKK